MSTVRMLKLAAKLEGGKLMPAELVCPDCSAPGTQTGSYGGFEGSIVCSQCGRAMAYFSSATQMELELGKLLKDAQPILQREP
jgi:hypothetical protein